MANCFLNTETVSFSQTYVRKVLYPHKILSLEVQQNDGLLSAQWQSQLQQVPADETPVRCGFMSVLNAYEPGCIAGALEGAMGQLKSQIEVRACQIHVYVFARSGCACLLPPRIRHE